MHQEDLRDSPSSIFSNKSFWISFVMMFPFPAETTGQRVLLANDVGQDGEGVAEPTAVKGVERKVAYFCSLSSKPPHIPPLSPSL